jgi:hypothetical protein
MAMPFPTTRYPADLIDILQHKDPGVWQEAITVSQGFY